MAFLTIRLPTAVFFFWLLLQEHVDFVRSCKRESGSSKSYKHECQRYSHGYCIHGTCYSTGCSCYRHYYGERCDYHACSQFSGYCRYGSCDYESGCICYANFRGRKCTEHICARNYGYCQGGNCIATSGCRCYKDYRGAKCNDRCDINNCVNGYEKWYRNTCVCDKCDGDYGSFGRAYSKSNGNRRCDKQCSWRSDSNACFPGVCSGTSCNCDNGFNGQDCRNLNLPPNILEPLATIRIGHSTIETSPPTPTSPTDTSYIELLSKAINSISLQIFMMTSFRWEIPSYLRIPAYMNQQRPISLGLTAASVSVESQELREPYSSEERQSITQRLINMAECTNRNNNWLSETRIDGAVKNWREGINKWEETYTFPLSPFTFSSSTRLKITWTSTNGGQMYLFNRDNNNRPFSRQYNGRTETKIAYFRIDNDKPLHCLEGHNCLTTMLDVEPQMSTGDGQIRVSFSDWVDLESCAINKYRLDVYHLSNDRSELFEVFTEPVYTNQSLPSVPLSIPLPSDVNIGVFSFVLTVSDFAGNAKSARRIVVHDTSSSISKIGEIVVSPASTSKQYQFITEINATMQTTLNIDWSGYFSNRDHESLGILNVIRGHNNVENDYDQHFGIRSIYSIPHNLGITNFKFSYKIDSTFGCRKAVAPSPWQDFNTSTTAKLHLDISDGDTICFWVMASDIVGHFNESTQIVYVDSSPPEISYLWLKKDDEFDVAVHNTINFLDMNVVFKTFDEHSGLSFVYWELYVNHTGDHEIYSNGTLPVIRTHKELCGSDCICIPEGTCYETVFLINFDKTSLHGYHDHDYFITVTVKNNAELKSIKTLKITIDTSAPLPGVVHDGMSGSTDVDFQQSMTYVANWNGFFDKESGIKYYEYMIGTACWEGQHSLLMDIHRTELHNTIEWVAPGPGRYFTSVIAYNKALEPSKVVCSDGVIIDTTPPKLTSVDVTGVRIKPGLVFHPPTEEVWFIDEYRKRCKVALDSVEYKCLIQARRVDDIWLYPEQPGLNNSMCEIKPLVCNPLDETLYLSLDRHIMISWESWDVESMISNFEVGLSSSPDNMEPDLARYNAQNHHHYTLYHPELSHGMEFYLTITATNKARLATTKVIGPIVIDTTPPEITDNATLTSTNNGLIVTWHGLFDSEDINIDTYIRIGQTEVGNSILPYQNIMTFENVDDGNQMTVYVPFQSLHWSLHANHVYYASVRVENTAGLSSIMTSSPYRHVLQLPSKGVVLDIDRHGVNFVSDIQLQRTLTDVDVQTDNHHLTIYWYGFQHAHLNITYKVAFGTEPGASDVSEGYIYVAGNTTYTLSGYTFEVFQTYYATVKAETSAGSVNITSDGITILPNSSSINFSVYDGKACNKSDAVELIRHHGDMHQPDCKNDISFQVSTSMVEAYWVIDDEIQGFLTHVLWSLEEEVLNNDTNTSWAVVKEFIDLGFVKSTIQTNLFLQNGGHYRSVVKFCHTLVCFDSIASDGFWIISSPPSYGTLEIMSANIRNDQAILAVQFQKFSYSQFVPELENTVDNIIEYHWAVVEKLSDNDNAFLTTWQKISQDYFEENGTKMQFEIHIDINFPMTSCLLFSLRGYSPVGLFSTTFTEIFKCDRPEGNEPELVIDVDRYVVGPLPNKWTDHPDDDYISSTTNMYAVWPTLKNSVFEWAVIKDNGPHQTNQGPKEPCQHQYVLQCGRTEFHYINVANLNLRHGQRYKVCIHANATNSTYEMWTGIIPEVSTCSDGVFVDITPPSPGKVWIGWNSHIEYQISVTEIVVSWESFMDIEEHDAVPHHSGIKRYEYALGSFPGGTDIVNFQAVGVSNSVIVNNLQLQNGHRYYATIRAFDIVGLTSFAISEAVVIDSTPPTINKHNFVLNGDNLIKSVSTIAASWKNSFLDPESGIALYEWGIGSNPGHVDIEPFVKTEYYRSINSDLQLEEGHSYFITVKATNNVGLVSYQSFGPYLVDASPPISGHVYDGIPYSVTSGHKDSNFQTDTTSLHASWEGFHDPHSALIGYWWTIGTCKRCNDVLQEQYIGLHTNTSVNHLQLVPGLIYYTTVRCCNSADLCSTVTSDGILIDDTPPSPGKVYDGPFGFDRAFQASRTMLSAHWWGFHDAESSISHYEWSAGTKPGASDILNRTRLHLTDSSFVVLDEIPSATTIYITVRAQNRAGLWNERSSDGFKVDDTAPEIIQPPTLDIRKGVIRNETQVLRSLIAIRWKFSDPDSDISAHYLSISSDHNDDIDIPTVKISGGAVEYTFTDLNLHDGSWYTIGVMACNGAGLCTHDYTSSFKVDSTPPSIGYFAVQSEHAANLQHRNVDGFMNWESDGNETMSLSLAWLGFSDVHSGIDNYLMTIGTQYNGQDLHENNIVRNIHNESGIDTEEGPIQTAIISLSRKLQIYDVIYLSLWAVNGVGLESGRAIAAFEVLPEGKLNLIRRCSRLSCDGHCVCASQNQMCSRGTCQTYTGDTVVNVTDVMHLQPEAQLFDVQYSPSRCIMAAIWNTSGTDIVRWYEWSVGLHHSANENPTGVFDISNERVWHDAGSEMRAVFTLPRGKELDKLNVAYDFFVRAWFDADTYAVYRSDGIVPDVTPPQIRRQRAVRVKDVHRHDLQHDIDVTTDPNEITLSWQNVFSDSSGIWYYEIALGSVQEGEDVRSFAHHRYPSETMDLTLRNLSLTPGKRYFNSVRAYNKAGLYSVQSSDGFIVDDISPFAGVVYDGTDLHDNEYQNNTNVISASWHGFVDFETSIDHYEWCVGTTTDTDECDVMEPISVGLRTSVSQTVSVELHNGYRYFSKITAIDLAGHRSEVAVSDGVIIDGTPPGQINMSFNETNLLKNPSFEIFGDSFEVETNVSLTNTTYSASNRTQMSDWIIDINNSHIDVIDTGLDVAQNGVMIVKVFGSISQTFQTLKDKVYRISFYVSHAKASLPNSLNLEALIQAPGLIEVFKLYDRPAHAHSSSDVIWMKHTFFFIASKNTSFITISSLDRSDPFWLDNVQVYEVKYGDRHSLSVEISAEILFNFAAVEASWHFIDPESPIIDYKWAIGYVKGGTQLQNFKSVGTRTHAINSNLNLVHGSEVTVSVVAKNSAGLTSIAYSEPLTIDFTPPVINYVYEGSNHTDFDYVFDNITISWSSSDEESGIKYCEYAVGSSPGGVDIQPLTAYSAIANNLHLNVTNGILEGQKVFTTVKCYNGAGLYTTSVTNGVILVSKPPDTEFATVNVISSVKTRYTGLDEYQGGTERLTAYWNGFSDSTGIAFYECKLSGQVALFNNWTHCGSSSERYLSLSNISLQYGAPYTINARAVNNAGLRSKAVVETFIVDQSTPTLTGAKIVMKRPNGDTTVVLTWEDVFASKSRLYYEISIGTTEGGSDVLQWVETLQPRLEVSPLHESTDYFVTITAVNAAGLYKTIKHTIIG